MNRDTRTKLIAAGFGLGAVVLMIVSALDGRDEETASADASAVLATIGDEELTEAEFEAFLRFKRVSLRSDEQSERVLGELVEREALAQAIEAHGDLDTALLEAELREFRKELLSAIHGRLLRPCRRKRPQASSPGRRPPRVSCWRSVRSSAAFWRRGWDSPRPKCLATRGSAQGQ